MRAKIRTGLLLLAAGTWSSSSGQVAERSAGARLTEAQQNLHATCIEAEEQAERQATEMVPGRTWTWALGAQRSLNQLNELRSDLAAMSKCGTEFVASLSRLQVTKYQTQLHGMEQLSQHLQRDAQSLQNELTKGQPRRWHVAHDALDMQKEIQHWRRLHNVVWAGLSTEGQAGNL
jgi:hypothetical protein